MKPAVITAPDEHSTNTLYAEIVCPLCGFQGWIDKDQWEGRVSIQCNEPCAYHETHDMRGTDPREP